MKKALIASVSGCFLLMVTYGVAYRSFQGKIRRSVAGFYSGKPDDPAWLPRQPRFKEDAKLISVNKGPVDRFEIKVVGLSPDFSVWAARVHVERRGVMYEETVQGWPDLDRLTSGPLNPPTR